MPTQDDHSSQDNALLIELARGIDPRKLKAQHQLVNGSCSSCRIGGINTARASWPCYSYKLAVKVEEFNARHVAS